MAQKDKGTLRPASGRFTRKRTKYPFRIKWRTCQILTLVNDPHIQFDFRFLDFSLLYRHYTCSSEGYGYSSSALGRISLKDSFKLLDSIWCFLRNVERLQKFHAKWWNIRAWTYYKIGICLTLRKFTLTSVVRDIDHWITTKSFFQA